MDFRFFNDDNKENVDQNAKELKRRPMPSFLTHNQDNTHVQSSRRHNPVFLFSNSDPRTDTMQQNGAAAVPQAPNISVQHSHVSSAIQDVR